MSDSTQSFIALMLGAIGLLAVGGLDAFHFERFGLAFDAGAILAFATACGIHWAIAPNFPFTVGGRRSDPPQPPPVRLG